MLDAWLRDQPLTRDFPRRELIEYARDNTIKERQVERWIEKQLEAGLLHRILDKRGFYRPLPKQ
jgi:hypothetical protein